MPFVAIQYAAAGNKWALLVGISDYGNAREEPGRWCNIHGANDIKLLKPLLAKEGFKVTALSNAQATHNSIVKALEQLANTTRRGDTVYLHFSMHGQPFEDLDGDEEDGWDEALIPVDAEMLYSEGKYEGNNHLLDDELEGYFEIIRSKIGGSGQLVVVMDACHSGTASRGDNDHIRGTREAFSQSGKEYAPDRTKETNDYFAVETKPGQSPVLFVEACRSYQTNTEVRDAVTDTWYGSLSYYIAEAYREGKKTGSDEWLEAIRTGMAGRHSLRKQNMVVEKSR